MLAESSRKTKENKAKEINFLKDQVFTDSQVVILSDFQGLDMENTTNLRSKCREKEVGYRVVKNTLAKIASKETPFEELFSKNDGNTALAYSKDDPGAVAKVLTEFAKDIESFQVKSGSLPGKLLSEKEIEDLAKLPTKEELFAKLLGTMNAVPTNFVKVLNEVPASFLRLLVAYKNSKEQTGE